MSDYKNIINIPVITDEQDIYWQPLPDNIINAPRCDTLVISLPFSPGNAEDTQLQKMMQACKLQPEQYNVVNIAEGEKYSWHQLRDTLKPKQVILLGILPHQLGISAIFHLFSPIRFNDTTWIAAPSLAVLEQQQEAKKQLWLSGLKPVFVDNAQANG